MAEKKFATQFDKTDSKKYQQKFDQNVSFKRKGKKIKINDFVQENAVGTDFYKNLEAFGNVETAAQFMNTNRQEIIADFKEATTLQDLETKRNRMKEIFYRMPAEIRGKFNNKFEKFLQNGEKFINEQEIIIQNLRKTYEQTQNSGNVSQTANNTGEQNQQPKPE